MIKFLIKRIFSLIPVVIIISILLFGMLKTMPGDPLTMYINPELTRGMKPAELEAYREGMRKKFGLDKPIHIQYLNWAGRTIQGDLGVSYVLEPGREITEVVGPRIVNSMKLNVVVLIFSFLIAIPIGVISAVKKFSLFDNFWQVFSLFGISLPSFLLGMIAISIFAVTLGWFPISGLQNISRDYPFESLHYIFLPAFVMIIGSLAGTIRYVRNAMIDVLSQDYIRTARAKGLSEKVVIFSHAFRNALIPVVTLVAFSIPALFGGSIVIETLFAWPGIGRTLIRALTVRDFAVVLTMNMFYAILALLANIIMDIGYAMVDPRVKLN